MEENKKNKNPTVGNLFALIFLFISSLGYAFAPNGFDNATSVNYVCAALSIVAGVNLLIALG